MPTWLLQLFSGGGIVEKIMSYIPNPAEREKAQQELQASLFNSFLQADADQRAINKEEAKSGSMFVAGWRPAVGWLCIATLAYQWIVAPLLSWIMLASGYTLPPLPTLGSDDTQTLLYALLGIGAYRTLDKAFPGGATQKILGMFKQ